MNIRSTPFRRSKGRSSSGQAFSIPALIFIVPITIGAILLVANVGTAFYNQEKLSLVCDQTALHMGSLESGNQTEGEAQAFAQSMIQQLDVPWTDARVGWGSSLNQGTEQSWSQRRLEISMRSRLLGRSGEMRSTGTGTFREAKEPPRLEMNKSLIWFGSPPPEKITAEDLKNGGKAFDGFVIQGVHGTEDDFSRGENFAWMAFTQKHYTLPGDFLIPAIAVAGGGGLPYTAGDYVGDQLAALKNLPSSPMPERFLRVNTSPYEKSHFNWKDNEFWQNVAQNMVVASKFCDEAHLRGIFLDSECYGRAGEENVYSYSSIAGNAKYRGLTREDLFGLAEMRGKQVMRALNSHCPNMTVFISFGYITASQHGSRVTDDDLLMPFLDGMLSASTPDTTFVDGFEESYWHDNNPNYFKGWENAIMNPEMYNVRFVTTQGLKEKYLKQYQCSFGLFLDRDREVGVNGGRGQSGVYGWCGDGKAKVFYSPGRLAYTVQQAVRSAKQYVWFYSQKPDAYKGFGDATAIPETYVWALKEGKEHGGNPAMPELQPDFDPAPEADSCGCMRAWGK